VFPVIGAFLVWAPPAAVLALQGSWRDALLLTGWGVLIIHPVDNLLGPVLVGSARRMHTLLMFFSVVGGIAAFGAAGVVLVPLTAAVALALLKMAGEPASQQPGCTHSEASACHDPTGAA
jgi:predicted PurR-regulated permease PerM